MSLQATPGESGATLQIGLATEAQRATIYRMRHAIYAQELGQHPENSDGTLRDELDQRNVYIAAAAGDRVVGFVSLTPPGAGSCAVWRKERGGGSRSPSRRRPAATTEAPSSKRSGRNSTRSSGASASSMRTCSTRGSRLPRG